jgi:hypothetical protein
VQENVFVPFPDRSSTWCLLLFCQSIYVFTTRSVSLNTLCCVLVNGELESILNDAFMAKKI